MNEEDFCEYFAKLLVGVEEIADEANLFTMHKTPDTSVPSDQDQTPISEPPTSAPPTQDQADDQPFEEAVPLEDELASLLDDIDD